MVVATEISTMKNEIIERLDKYNPKSAWKKGVKEYAYMLLEDIEEGEEITEETLLNGAENWREYSYGGCSLIYDEDICKILCSPSVIKRKREGELPPNRYENWLDVQARALYQASRLILHKTILI